MVKNVKGLDYKGIFAIFEFVKHYNVFTPHVKQKDGIFAAALYDSRPIKNLLEYLLFALVTPD